MSVSVRSEKGEILWRLEWHETRKRERESTVHGQRLVLVAYSCHASSDEGVWLWLWSL